MIVELIPYRTFKEKIRIVREQELMNKHVEVWDGYVYAVSKSKDREEIK